MAPTVQTLLAIGRVSNLPTVWMNVWTAAVLAAGEPPVVSVGLLMVALSASYCGGMVLNDYFDRGIDAREQPFRPIPAGRIDAHTAARLAAALLAAGVLLLALQPHPSAVAPGLLLLVVIYAYDRWHKAHASAVLLMAASRTLVYVVVSWALIGGVPLTVLLAGSLSFGWTLSVTAVARWENQRGRRFGFPVIPWMIAAMPILDGAVLAALVAPGWILVGVMAAGLTRAGQTYVRGD